MKKIPIYLLLILLMSCSYQDCNGLQFDKKSKTTFLNNKPFTGKCDSFYYSGNIKSHEEYLNGKDHGSWSFYFKDGSVQTKGVFEKGLRIGKWEYFFENKNVWKINFYDPLGLKIGIWKEYDENGNLIKEKKY